MIYTSFFFLYNILKPGTAGISEKKVSGEIDSLSGSNQQAGSCKESEYNYEQHYPITSH